MAKLPLLSPPALPCPRPVLPPCPQVVAASTLGREDIPGLTSMFKQLDHDRTGQLSAAELRVALQRKGERVSEVGGAARSCPGGGAWCRLRPRSRLFGDACSWPARSSPLWSTPRLQDFQRSQRGCSQGTTYCLSACC